ncbi:helix-turn-helix domain-containing protein [Streptomyces sp. MP131-18]|uniref:ArsR/SmtB family transcription factor n=1 Tax=Streptomyces sp. MP131-18 TaxID=1857892 RepID=UPI00097C3A9B|nr:helix-turn-helix domain-containing protein [Streptomyces sp. MP131-18]ONK11237.1 Helix-turn-helix domain protein [Streptomyces sp. MP131-18]
MAVRIHLSSADLRSVTVARCAEPLCEMERSLRALRLPTRDPVTVRWRQWARRQLPKAAYPLLTLVPASGPSPDFLTPLTTSPDLAPALNAVLSTPPARLLGDLGPLADRSRPSSWVADLTSGRRPALRRLELAITSYHDAILKPVEHHLTTEFDTAADGMAQTLARGGLDALLRDLHPSIRWEPPILHVAHRRLDEDVRLHGQGLHLIPSFFASSNAVMNDVVAPYVVVFPMRRRALWHADSGRPARALADLLGDTRATLLYAIARAARGVSTTALAQRAGIANSTASHHVKALRGAQLVATRRAGTSALHTLTPLGEQVLRSNPHPAR